MLSFKTKKHVIFTNRAHLPEILKALEWGGYWGPTLVIIRMPTFRCKPTLGRPGSSSRFRASIFVYEAQNDSKCEIFLWNPFRDKDGDKDVHTKRTYDNCSWNLNSEISSETLDPRTTNQNIIALLTQMTYRDCSFWLHRSRLQSMYQRPSFSAPWPATQLNWVTGSLWTAAHTYCTYCTEQTISPQQA